MAWTLKNHLGLTNYCHTHTQKRKPFFGLWFKTFKDLLFIKLSVELKKTKPKKQQLTRKIISKNDCTWALGMKEKEWRDRATESPTLLQMSDGKCYCWFIFDWFSLENKIWNVTDDLQLAWNPCRSPLVTASLWGEFLWGMLSLAERRTQWHAGLLHSTVVTAGAAGHDSLLFTWLCCQWLHPPTTTAGLNYNFNGCLTGWKHSSGDLKCVSISYTHRHTHRQTDAQVERRHSRAVESRREKLHESVCVM